MLTAARMRADGDARIGKGRQMVKLAKDWTRTALTARLGIDIPVIQGALGGFNTQRLSAAVSNFGGLGSFGAHGLAPEAIRAVIAEMRGLTAKPFAINLWVSMEDDGARDADAAMFQRSLQNLLPHIDALGGSAPGYTPYKPMRFEDQVRVLLDEKIPVFSFIVGIPPKEILDECRAKGIITIGTATTVDEAIAVEQAGIDIVSASGFEAGGHRGSFLRPAAESLIGTFSLVPQIADAVSIPVVAAGGIADARGVVAALALGADGVQIGTAFLGSENAGANALHRAAILNHRAGDTVLTKALTGRLARGIHNRLIDELDRPGAEILPYPLQRALVKSLTGLAEKAGQPELLQMWAGQSANLTRYTDEIEFLRHLVAEVSGA
jgi:nitronate monooxygenase